MYVISSCFQLFTCMFFNFTAARDESSSDSDRDVPEEFEPPLPPPGQGRPTKPSHDRQAKGGRDIPGLQQANMLKAQFLNVSSSLQSYSPCIPQFRLDLQNI